MLTDAKPELIGLVMVSLAVAGYAYNKAVDWLEQEGYAEGYTALLVVAGVLVTLAGVAVLDWQAALLCGICFAASGAFMVLGSIARYAKARKKNQERLRGG